MTSIEGKSIQNTARAAGFLYLLMIPFAFFSLYVRSNLVVPGDAATTVDNIIASETLLRTSIVSWLICQIVFVLAILALYKLLSPVSLYYARLMAILALAGVPVAFLNELNQFAALSLSTGTDYFGAIGVERLHAQVMLFLDLHEHGISIAQVFWGCWLFPLGYLIIRSGFLPRILGILLIISGLGYVIDAVVFFMASDTTVTISLYTFIGEVVVPLWLLIKGVDVEKWERRAR